jgi:hypothetical protein
VDDSHAGNVPSFNQLAQHATRVSRNVPTVIEYEPLWPIEVRRTILLREIAGIVEICAESDQVGQSLAPRVRLRWDQNLRHANGRPANS